MMNKKRITCYELMQSTSVLPMVIGKFKTEDEAFKHRRSTSQWVEKSSIPADSAETAIWGLYSKVLNDTKK